MIEADNLGDDFVEAYDSVMIEKADDSLILLMCIVKDMSSDQASRFLRQYMSSSY